MDAGNEVVAQVKLLQMWQQLDAFGAPENIALQPLHATQCNHISGQQSSLLQREAH